MNGIRPRCPVCGRVGSACGPDLFRCSLGHLFDDDPNEGGTHHADPSRRIELAEERERARRENLARLRASAGFRFHRRGSLTRELLLAIAEIGLGFGIGLAAAEIANRAYQEPQPRVFAPLRLLPEPVKD